MILSHYRAGTGAVLLETREESRAVRQIVAELPADAQVCRLAAPGGPIVDVRTGLPEQGKAGLLAGYEWAASGPGRVLCVFDYHVLCNAPGHWRALADPLPALRSPKGGGPEGPASLVVFIGPQWDIQTQNPLRGLLPVLTLPAPDRDTLRQVAEALRPLNGAAEAVVDALCGLSTDAAEQAAAEVLARPGGVWDVDGLRDARRQALREAGLELWPAVSEMGGLAGFRAVVDGEVVPWVRDEQLSVRRILCAGVPGVGKSYGARWLAGRLGCECARLSIPALKGGLVGQSEGNLKRALRTLDALGQHAPIVCVMDEIDGIASEGLDGGTSSGMFSELLTWLQESRSQCVVLATLNRLDKLNAALESRFQARFWFDLPSPAERLAVAAIHYRRLHCARPDDAAAWTVEHTVEFSSREIAEHVCPSVARLTQRTPDAATVKKVCTGYTPASRTQTEQLNKMRSAAGSLRRANDPETVAAKPSGRRVAS